MSYSISLRYANDLNTIIDIDKPLGIYGTTYSPDNTELWYSCTYNYRPFFLVVFGEGGVYNLVDMTGKDSIPIIINALQKAVFLSDGI